MWRQDSRCELSHRKRRVVYNAWRQRQVDGHRTFSRIDGNTPKYEPCYEVRPRTAIGEEPKANETIQCHAITQSFWF